MKLHDKRVRWSNSFMKTGRKNPFPYSSSSLPCVHSDVNGVFSK